MTKILRQQPLNKLDQPYFDGVRTVFCPKVYPQLIQLQSYIRQRTVFKGAGKVMRKNVFKYWSLNAASDSGPSFLCRMYFSILRGSGMVTGGLIFRTNEFPDQPHVLASISTKPRIESEHSLKTVREKPDISRLVINRPEKTRCTSTE